MNRFSEPIYRTALAPIVVIGSINYDLVVRVPRLPRPGETVNRGEFHRVLGGKGANQAAAAARLGGDVALAACVGADDFGREARANLQAQGVDVDGLTVTDGDTGVAVIVVDGGGENTIAVADGANALLSPVGVRRVLNGSRASGVVLVSLEVPDAAVVEAARLTRAAGGTFILNPAPARPLAPELLGLSDILTPNQHELVGLGRGDDDRTAIRSLLGAGVQAVIVTLGAGGADLHRRDASVMRQRAFPVAAVDTTGAGDAFNGALAWALAAGDSLESALRFAVAAGALATTRVGAQSALPDRMAVEALLESETSTVTDEAAGFRPLAEKG